MGGTLAPGRGEDLILSMSCRVTGPQGDGDTNPHKYHYGNINIIKGGSLTFDDARIEFWAKSILIENGGSLIAGTEQAPIGNKGGLTIVLYGDEKQPTGTGKGDGGQGIICRSPTDGNTGPCGIPLEPQWNSQGTRPVELPGTDEHGAPITDYFYRYEPLPYDDGGAQKGYFGYRVLALSYGGTLKLFGKRGATSAALDPMDSGTSWVRLAKSVTKGDDILVLDREVDWKEEDQIVLTTTDYLPGHSEELTVQEVGPDKKTIRVKQSVKFAHNGAVYPLDTLPARLKLDFTTAEIRAAVALLTRSIRIVSGGERFGERFSHDSYIGGHTVVRQGFLAYQVQGVELAQLGQGGRLGHYPIHFHMARKAPSGTFVRDSSINESMTRWITLHATHNVTLQRNVGWKSIGHGFYLEDGTEINNNLYSNIGIFARAAVYDADGAKSIRARCRASWPRRTISSIPSPRWRSWVARTCRFTPTTTIPPCSGS